METIILEEYAERLRRLRRDRRTIANFCTVAKRLDHWLAETGHRFEELRPYELEEYLASLDYLPSTKKLHLTQIRAAARYAQRRGCLPVDPTLDVQLERRPDREPRIIPASDLRSIRDVCTSERERLIIDLLIWTGMRRNEIRTLTWADVDRPRRTFHVLGKGGKLRHVPIHPALGELLGTSNQPVHPSAPVIRGRRRFISETSWIETMRRVAGPYTAHDFRRTVATSLARNNVPERVIDRIMGWSPRSVGRRYYIGVADEEMHEGIRHLYSDDPV